MRSCLPGDDRLVYPVLRQLNSESPVVTQIEPLLLDEGGNYLVRKAHEDGFDASEIGRRGKSVVSEMRTSRTSYLPEDDAVVACIGERLAAVAGMPPGSLEPMQATAYAHKQQYKAHLDNEAPGRTGHQRR